MSAPTRQPAKSGEKLVSPKLSFSHHGSQVDVIVGLDARGFLLGPAMALAINKPFVPIRFFVVLISDMERRQKKLVKLRIIP